MILNNITRIFDQYNNKYKDKFCDFANIEGIKSYVLLRHDVEFSPRRALEIARIENSENISSSYLFQVRSNAYNVLSTINRKIINEIIIYPDIEKKIYSEACKDSRKTISEEKNLILNNLSNHFFY